jgi:hypothetical protein
MPVVAEIPAPETLECEEDPGEMHVRHPELPWSACMTEEVSVAGFPFHYHCHDRRGRCEAFVRSPKGGNKERGVRGTYSSMGIPLRHAEDVDGLLIEHGISPLRLGNDAWVYKVDVPMTRVAPRRSWTVMVTIGCGIGLFAVLVERCTRSTRIRKIAPKSLSVLALTAVVVLSAAISVWAIRFAIASTA